MKEIENFDSSDFWNDSEYALQEYLSESPSDELIQSIEKELGYKLPNSYIELMKEHNGGIPKNTCFPTNEETSWAPNHVAISGIMGIGRDKNYSIGGDLGSQFKIDEWGYPNDGVYICNCPSAGHDMILLDYSECGPKGEPKVVHVDQEFEYKKTFLASDFATFIKGLVNDNVFDTSEEDLKTSLVMIKTGKFSPFLNELLNQFQTIDLGPAIRILCFELATSKGYFALHDDALSYTIYDLQFLLLSESKKISSKEKYLAEYPAMIAMAEGDFSTGGYAPEFIKDWLDKRFEERKIEKRIFKGLTLTEPYKSELMETLRKYSNK